MKIAVPVNETDIKAEVCPSFGRAPYYAVYDTETKTAAFLDNGAAISAGGAGIKAAQLLIDSGVKILIAPRQGENAAKVLAGAGVAVYKNIAGSAEDNIKAYETDRLSLLADIHPGYHKHAGE